MNISTRFLPSIVYKSLNSRHPYKQKIREYAEHGMDYNKLDYSHVMEITALYIDYCGDDLIDIEITRSLALKLLTTNDYASMSKIVGDLESERDGVIMSIINTYKHGISEDIDEEIERCKDGITEQEDVEIGSVNSGEFI